MALASSQLHFTDQFNVGFKKNKKTTSFSFSLTISSLGASKPLHLFIESHQQYSYWHLIYTGFYLFCTVNTLCLIQSVKHTHEPLFIPQGHFTTNEKEKEALAFRDIFNNHETHLINSYDAGLR